jgi:hypothetical protein
VFDLLKTVIDWLVPPVDHDELTQYLWRVRIAVFGCFSFAAVAYIVVALLFEWGPEIVRPASAQTVHREVDTVKKNISAQFTVVQSQLSTISTTQSTIQKQQFADRLERIEQQLLWWRQQNCRSKGTARNYTWQKMSDLKDRYRELTNTDWQMPACTDIGE